MTAIQHSMNALQIQTLVPIYISPISSYKERPILNLHLEVKSKILDAHG